MSPGTFMLGLHTIPGEIMIAGWNEGIALKWVTGAMHFSGLRYGHSNYGRGLDTHSLGLFFSVD